MRKKRRGILEGGTLSKIAPHTKHPPKLGIDGGKHEKKEKIHKIKYDGIKLLSQVNWMNMIFCLNPKFQKIYMIDYTH